MANGPTKDQLLLAHSSKYLTYGHLGTPSYDTNTHQWSFLRRLTASSAHQSEESRELSSSVAFPYSVIDGHVKDLNKPKKLNENLSEYRPAISIHSTKGFLRYFPDVVPIASQTNINHSLVPEVTQVNCSDRLAFGHATWLPEQGRRSAKSVVPIAALVSGPNGGWLKLTRLSSEQLELANAGSMNNTILIPAFFDRDEAWWIGNSEPIRKVCFANKPGYPVSSIACLQESCVTLLHPLLRRRPVPTRHATDESAQGPAPSSTLDANPVLVLPRSRTGGFPLADVAFNHQDHNILGIIDEQGNWSIWQTEGNRSKSARNLFRIELQICGKLFTWQTRRVPDGMNPYFDGWHRLCWLGASNDSVDQFLVCNRRSIALIDLLGANLGSIDLHLGSIREGQEILDLKKSNTNQSYCYILTSTLLFLVAIVERGSARRGSRKQLEVILSWRHFRDRADTTLRLALAETARSTTIMIFSQKYLFISSFRVGLELEPSEHYVSLADPTSFVLPTDQSSKSIQPPLLDLVFRELEVQNKKMSISSTPSMMKLFVQHSNFEITEILYQCTHPTIRASGDTGNLSSFGIQLYQPHSTQNSQFQIDDLDDFVIEGDAISTSDGGEHQSRLAHVTGISASETQLAKRPFGTDLSDIYDQIQGHDLSALRKRGDFANQVGEVRSKLIRFGASEKPLALLSDLFNRSLYVSDVEEDSETLSSLLKDLESSLNLSNVQMGNTTNVQPDTIFDLYSSISDAWISTLPPEMPDRVRVNKERLARVISADLALARVAVRRSPTQPNVSGSAGRDSGSANPSQSAPTSVYHADTVSAIVEGTENSQEDPSCVRLRNLTTLKYPIPPISTSQTLSDILSHIPISISVSPSTYNWRATSQALVAQHDAENIDLLDPKARRQFEMKVEGRRLRFEKQKKMSQRVEDERTRSMLVRTTQRSSPGPLRQVQSSQIAGPSSDVGVPGSSQVTMPGLTMTQPERGAHGKRLPDKGKVKGKPKKLAGFR